MSKHCQAKDLLAAVQIIARPGFPAGTAWILPGFILVSADDSEQEQRRLATRALAKRHEIPCVCGGITRDAVGA